MKNINILIFVFFFLTMNICSVKAKHIDTTRAVELFNLFEQMRQNDRGDLWNMAMHKNMLFIEPQTYEFVANAPLAAYNSNSIGTLNFGTYPKEKAIANTTVLINNDPWTMVMWPLPGENDRALELMAHEAFHSMQKSLGFNTNSSIIEHMDKKEARVLFRLEMNALYVALFEGSSEAIADALLFRQKRFQMYPDGKQAEIIMETHEGLAQYTGFKFAYQDRDRVKTRLKENMQRMEQKSSLARATAYTSGPLYGLLLDASGKPWRKQASPVFNAFKLCKEVYAISSENINSIDYEAVREKYDFDRIAQEETQRWTALQQKISNYTAQFLGSHSLEIVLKDKNISFNPNKVVPLAPHGTVYEYFILKDQFGSLTAEKGALMSADWSTVRISKPLKITDTTVEGDGWTMHLKKGYGVVKREDKYIISQTN